MKVNVLKNILMSLMTTHSEVNIVLSANPLSIQFVSAKYECILYWKVDDILARTVTPHFYRSETVQIEKILKVLTTDTIHVTLALGEEPDDSSSNNPPNSLHNSLIFEQRCSIDNCMAGKNSLVGLEQIFNIKIPLMTKHPEVTDYITDYVHYKHEFKDKLVVSAIFNIKMLEKMINTSLNYTTEVEFSVKDNMMKFSTELGDNLSIASVLTRKNQTFRIMKKIEIGSISFIKAYRKMSNLISISLLSSTNRHALLVKPVTSTILDTELVLFFN